MRESRETHTPASLGLLLEQLDGIVASVKASKILLESAGVAHVETQRAAGRETGCKMLQGFADALRDATRAGAMKALQAQAPLSALSDAPANGSIHGDSSESKPTKRKPADKSGSRSKTK